MSRPLFAIAFGALQNRDEAEDVVQDAFVKAWKAHWQLRNPEKFPAWRGLSCSKHPSIVK
jgi:DNA-directed RNA polymerase specialized sigma24 family protein